MARTWYSFSGELMIVNSAVHTVVGLAIYGATLAGMIADGLVDTVHVTREREAAWWFFLVGLLYLTVGLVLRWIRRQNVPPPASTGWILIGLAVVGLGVAPSFGWPFIATAGVMALISRRHTATADTPAV